NGQGIMTSIVYQMGTSTNAGDMNMSGYRPTTVASGDNNTYDRWYAAALGIVSQSQVVYTRAGSNLTIQPLGTNAFDKSTIPTYNMYFSDTWHMKPTLTLTYGLSYQIEMPPYEQDGKQVSLIDSTGTPVDTVKYLAARKAAALQGQVYNP